VNATIFLRARDIFKRVLAGWDDYVRDMQLVLQEQKISVHTEHRSLNIFKF
jgi:hypothetical protein